MLIRYIYATALHVYSDSTEAKPVETGLAPVPRQAEETITLHLSSSRKIFTQHVYMFFIT